MHVLKIIKLKKCGFFKAFLIDISGPICLWSKYNTKFFTFQ